MKKITEVVGCKYLFVLLIDRMHISLFCWIFSWFDY